ncbi:30S ribosomal protein S2 [Candidatus Roizmanbacteria bacterium CG_4_10_14_0_8_um_filter_33_9]|uniref:Small ribosomal subunit protein uS2 n=1 Tax=Candidatus Roizmanbacteria bacterium CG_4_10_14_0_8_um_filter_33_9 TaxID=1974826 RepID=A0A2M7QIE5_9BACT|nr:MAG: 30S ribosomal protein S2 [Candidatus Roizmanbacteria bacterium CG_4_10_14_0_8_um_filter_33_9]
MEEQTKQIEKLFKAGVHLGHKRNRLHPKARKYVYKMINGTAVIDLTQTVKQLNKAKEVLKQAAKDNKKVLVVATKKIINQFITETCTVKKVPFITQKWPSGLLTNFEMIMKNVKKMKSLEEGKANGSWDKFVKHERTKLSKELYKLNKFYFGLSLLEKKPDYILLLDLKKEKNALTEAKKHNIPVIAAIDTNANPETVDFPIMINDDSGTSVQLVMKELLDAYVK